jgi:hypothetical protein
MEFSAKVTMAHEHFIDRALLHFADEVKHLVFLEAMDFHCVEAGPTFVRYESPTMSINVYHGRHSYEIDLELESVGVQTESYSFSAIVRLLDPKRGESYRKPASHTAEGVASAVRRHG